MNLLIDKRCNRTCEFYKPGWCSNYCMKSGKRELIKSGRPCMQGLKVDATTVTPLRCYREYPTTCLCGCNSGYNKKDCENKLTVYKERRHHIYNFAGDSYDEIEYYYITVLEWYAPCPACGALRHVRDDVVEEYSEKDFR